MTDFNVTVNGSVQVPPSVHAMVGGTSRTVAKIFAMQSGQADVVYENPAALQAPSNGSATVDTEADDSDSFADVDTSWTLNTSTEDRVHLQESNDQTNWSTVHHNLPQGTEQALDIPMSEGETKYFRVRVEKDTADGTEVSPWSNTFQATAGIDAPRNLDAVAGVEEVDLTWDNWSPYDDIEIHRNGSLLTTIGGGNTSYTDTGLTGGTTYTYEVRGVSDDAGTSGFSNSDSATPSSSTAPETLLPVSDRSTNDASLWNEGAVGDGDGDFWDEVDEVGSTELQTNVDTNSGPLTRSFEVNLANPAEAHDDTQIWTVTAEVEWGHLNCEVGTGGTTDLELGEGTSTIIAQDALAVNQDDAFVTISFTLTDAEINSITNLNDLWIRVTANLNSVCCTDCGTQFETYSTETFSITYVALEITG